jgi:hypothetical protein
VDSTTDAVDTSPGDGLCATAGGECTLRAAVQETNALPGADTVQVPAGTYLLTIPGANEDAAAAGDLDITDDLAVTGADRDLTVIDGGSLDRVLHAFLFFHTSLNVEFSDLTIRNGRADLVPMFGDTDNGGGVFLGDGVSAHLEDVVIRDNTSSDAGGGVWAGTAFPGSALRFSRVEITGNTAGLNNGGGLYNLGVLTLTDSAVSGNSGGAGGGIYNGRELRVERGRITGNAAATGAGIDNASGTDMTLDATAIVGNHANSAAGITTAERTTIRQTTISANVAQQEAGGLYIPGSSLVDVTESAIVGNRAGGDGGGIYVANLANARPPRIVNSTISGNIAGAEGAGIFVFAGGLDLTNVTVAENIASTDGGGFGSGEANGPTISVVNSLIAENQPDNCSRPIASAGHNLEDADDCGLSAGGDRPNSVPVLAPLGDYGGPTQTHAIPAYVVEGDAFPPLSAALDAANPTFCPALDQRGEPRPRDGNDDGVAVCDIGAYEAPDGFVCREDCFPVSPGASPTPAQLPDTGGPPPRTGSAIVDPPPRLGGRIGASATASAPAGPPRRRSRRARGRGGCYASSAIGSR